MSLHRCPCLSGKPFNKCCQIYLLKKKKPATVSKLMRSRYCAFAIGGFGEYLLSTWHPDYREQLTAEQLSIRSTDWIDLQIIDSYQQGDEGAVEFIAQYKEADGSYGEHHERSRFVRHKGQWLYCDGTLLNAQPSVS